MPSPIETHTTVTLKLSREKRAAWQAEADRDHGGNISAWLRTIADRNIEERNAALAASGAVRKIRTRVVTARVPDESMTGVRPFPQ